jgi:signal transduction histidine kinase
MKLLEYFSVYYLQLRQGYIFILDNLLIAAMIPVLLYPERGQNRCSWMELVTQMVVAYVGMELIGAVTYAVLGNAFALPFIGGVILLALFLLPELPRLSPERIALVTAYAGMYSVTLSFCMAVGEVWNVEDFQLEWMLIIVFSFLMISLTLLFRQLSWNRLASGWLLLPIVVISCINYVFGCCFTILSLRMVDVLVINLLLLAILVATYYGCFTFSRWLQKSRQDYGEQLVRQADEALLSALKSDMEQYSRMRHDMNNHYLLMRQLLAQKEYDKLDAYFEECVGQLALPPTPVRCSNPTVSAILNLEHSKAEREQIQLETTLAVPEKLGIADADLCSLLTNLIDNALEYLGRHPEASPRQVAVELHLVHHSLAVTVSNPVRPEDTQQALSLRTVKTESGLHGRGSKIVASVAKRYEGTVCYQVKDGRFEASVLLTEQED